MRTLTPSQVRCVLRLADAINQLAAAKTEAESGETVRVVDLISRAEHELYMARTEIKAGAR